MIHVKLQICMYIYVCIDIHVFLHRYVYICACIYQQLYLRVHVYIMNICIYICIYIFIFMYVYIYTYIYVHVYEYLYVRYRVAKTHVIRYLYSQFSAKEPCNYWLSRGSFPFFQNKHLVLHKTNQNCSILQVSGKGFGRNQDPRTH